MEYLKVNDIKDYDYEFITAIDKDINDRIDYQVYDKLRKFRIKWIKFDNFQSYGSGNCFDFSNLHGLVLLNGEPANQSGKTTFAVDLFHFLLFGKTSKAKVFIAGAVEKDGKLLTSGGRVIACSANGETFDEAWKKAYEAIEGVSFEDMFYRKDIGLPGAAESN